MAQSEAARIEALRNLGILDTAPSESFDRITRMAARIFDLPVAAVSLTDSDRQWFKSRVGVDHWELPREKAPCAEVAENAEVVLIQDLLKSENYHDSPLGKSGVRFYAGAPLVTREGHGLGALCVVGPSPRSATDEEISALKDLAAMVMSQIEMQHAFGRIDPESGLPNRHQFFEDLEDLARDHAGEWRHAVVVDLLSGDDLTNLLRVAGPSALENLTARSLRAIRAALSSAKLYAVGQTQYAFVVESAEIGDVLAIVAQIRDETAGRADTIDAAFTANTTIGVAPVELGKVSARDVLRMASGASHDARDAGEAIGLYSRSLDDAHRRRFSMLEKLRRALVENAGLSLHFQPRVDLRSGGCIGAEALLRWTDPELGSVSPAEFIPLVEKTTLARSVTEWVVAAAVAQVAGWRALGIDLVVSLNISAANLVEVDFADRLIAELEKASLPSSAIEIELTESAVIANGASGFAQLDQIAAAGIRIAIDDFGTGYSSLSYLERLPADVMKIDRSFMANIGRDARTDTLVGTMITLAHDLGYRVVAEGVETIEVYDFLAEKGCDEVQGYLIARPLTPSAFVDWFKDAESRLEPEPARLSA
ncbi:EAL domain-containing protein [Hansschlegelia quercus]|uniref:Sensor domain-containing phosphodiesterase n=1 Tax=Hansschlegelia quercus TaxID=2528245 RepID=A0A4Q9GA14_9HYPH|nr:sensor domain-containing phosphodiesterase [Hansschlegelia quercus]TBN47640.1 sensor domain-containing phosphodiesterase [Hansschlegelia quercus]